MSILLHWRNKTSPNNKGQGALDTDKKSHIMKHLLGNKTCKSLCDEGCFQVTDYASSLFRLKVKEALHIDWLKPDLNNQKVHVRGTRVLHFSTFTHYLLSLSYY